MKYILGLALILLMACNSGTGNNDFTEDNLPNPEKIQPPRDAIPGDMEIKNDSVVVPDSGAVKKEVDAINKSDTVK